MSDQERMAILEQARLAGVDSTSNRSWRSVGRSQRSWQEVTEETQACRRSTVPCAFGILRCDEQPNGAERIYLAKLAGPGQARSEDGPAAGTECRKAYRRSSRSSRQ